MVFFFHRRWRKSGGKKITSGGSYKCRGGEQVFPENDFTGFKGTLKGLIMEEDGLDVLYWKGVIGDKTTISDFNKDVFHKNHYIPEAPPPPPPPSSHPPAMPALAAQKAASPTPPPTPPRSTPARPPATRTAPTCDSLSQEGSINKNVDLSTASQRIPGESLRYNGDIMEALFGSVATNKKRIERKRKTPRPKTKPMNPRSEIYILDAKKSRSTAKVLRSLVISRQDIIDVMLRGRGLNAETLEKLTKIAPTEEEQFEIIAFDGDITRLAEAESFLYHLLRQFPSAFARFNALLFRSTYHSTIRDLNDTLKTLELACEEITNHGLTLKLLTAIVKSSSIGCDTRAFDLSSFLKLLDPTSLAKNATLVQLIMDEDEAITMVSQFPNVTKAAKEEYDMFAKTLIGLTASVAQTRKLLTDRDCIGDEGFARVIKSFLQEAEKCVNEVKKEEVRVMELVIKTTTNDYRIVEFEDKPRNPLEPFVVLYDFFAMIDQACGDIAKTLRGTELHKT